MRWMAALIAGGLALAAWVWLRTPDRDLGLASRAEDRSRDTIASPAPLAGVARGDASKGVPEAAEETAGREVMPERAALATTTVDPDASDKTPVRIVDEDERPVPGARVLHRIAEAGEDPDRWHPKFRDESEIDAWMAEQCTETLADAEGIAWIDAAFDRRNYLVARRAELWGRSALSPRPKDATWTEEERTLEVAEEVEVEVLVVGADRTPRANVEVAFRLHYDWGSTHNPVTAHTDEQGLARLRHLQQVRGWNVDGRLVIALNVPLDPLVEAPFAWTEPPEEPVVLQLPETTRLELEVVEGDGTPFRGEGTLRISGRRPQTGQRQENRWRWPAMELSLEHRVVLPELQTGLEVELIAMRGKSREGTTKTVSMPQEAGQVAQARLVLGADRPVASWLLVDDEGQPLADAYVSVGVVTEVDDDRSRQDTSLCTDETGRLLVDLREGWSEGEQRTVIVRTRDEPARSAMASLDRPLPNGRQDLGRLVLRAPPLLVSGTVLAADGSPAPHATFTLERSRESWWRRDQGMRNLRSDAQGRFAWHAESLWKTWRLRATKGDEGSPYVTFSTGSRDLLLQLERTGTIRGLVKGAGDAGDEDMDLSVTLEIPGAGHYPARLPDSRIHRSVTLGEPFEIPDVLPGTYDVVIEGSDEVHRWEAVAVTSGATVELAPFDLSYHNRYAIELVPPQPGSSIGHAELILHPIDAPDEEDYHWFGGTNYVVLDERTELAARIHVSGYQPVVIERLEGENRIELARGYPVRIRLVGDARLPEPPVFLRPSLADPEHGPVWDDTIPAFGEEREVSMTAIKSGALAVHWVVRRPSGTSHSSWLLPHPTEQIVEVLDVTHEQVIDVRLTQEELDALLAQTE